MPTKTRETGPHRGQMVCRRRCETVTSVVPKIQEATMASKSARYTAKLKAKKAKERLRKAGRLVKRKAGGRLVKRLRKS